jgi:hypothetical protein
MKSKLKKKSDYKPYNGFYDLRAFDLNLKEFRKFWNVQEFLFTVESDRRKGKIHPQISDIRNMSGQYQQSLFSHRIINPDFI